MAIKRITDPYYIGHYYVDDRRNTTEAEQSLPLATGASTDGPTVLHSQLRDGTRIVKPYDIRTRESVRSRLTLYVDRRGKVVGQERG